ncbi:MAG TPA: alpha/beta hydrolase [Alphaproteobacteria bacterium]|nr:alpha/beta hydrolase [Alphaproteobacteria bacterium]
MSETIFLHYTKAELDRNFDQRGWIGVENALAVLARGEAASRATRARLKHRADLRYGDDPDETLDLFETSRTGAPIVVFVHGGAWRNFTKHEVSFVAEGFVPAGAHVAILNFTNLPTVRLPRMVEQVRSGIAWVYRNARELGGDPARIHLVAHSSGSHLSAMALITDWQARGLPPDVVKSASLASGVYDLDPVVLSARASYVKIDDAERAALSPIRHAARVPCPVLIAHAEGDTDEFQRQSRAFASALEGAGRLAGQLRVPGVNHFELMESLGSPTAALPRAIHAQNGFGLQECDAR